MLFAEPSGRRHEIIRHWKSSINQRQLAPVVVINYSTQQRKRHCNTFLSLTVKRKEKKNSRNLKIYIL